MNTIGVVVVAARAARTVGSPPVAASTATGHLAAVAVAKLAGRPLPCHPALSSLALRIDQANVDRLRPVVPARRDVERDDATTEAIRAVRHSGPCPGDGTDGSRN
jgi:hypothetical protein